MLSRTASLCPLPRAPPHFRAQPGVRSASLCQQVHFTVSGPDAYVRRGDEAGQHPAHPRRLGADELAHLVPRVDRMQRADQQRKA